MTGYQFYLRRSMNQRIDKKLIFFHFLIIGGCFFSSFINYLVTQIIGSYALPFTIVPFCISMIIGYQFPALAVISIGLSDDLFLNTYLGFFPVIYSFLAYMFSLKIKTLEKRKFSILLCVCLYVIINIFLGFIVRD